MDREIVFFIITMASIVIVNSMFFIINVAFVGAVTGILYYYQRKMHQALTEAIKKTQKMLNDPKTHIKLIESIHEYTQHQTAAFMGNAGKNFKKWLRESGAPEQVGNSVEGIFSWLSEALGKNRKQKDKISALGKAIQYIKDRQDQSQEAPAQTLPEELQITPEQEKALLEAQEKIFTKEQKEAMGFAEAGKENSS